MLFKITKIEEEVSPVNNVDREEINTEDLSQFSSEFGLIGKNIYIPKLIHHLDGTTSAASLKDVKYTSDKEYPHIK